MAVVLFAHGPLSILLSRAMKPEHLADEIGLLIKQYGFKSVFDDTGCFPAGEWLRRFAKLIIERGYNKKVQFSCNMRFGALTREDYQVDEESRFPNASFRRRLEAKLLLIVLTKEHE